MWAWHMAYDNYDDKDDDDDDDDDDMKRNIVTVMNYGLALCKIHLPYLLKLHISCMWYILVLPL